VAAAEYAGHFSSGRGGEGDQDFGDSVASRECREIISRTQDPDALNREVTLMGIVIDKATDGVTEFGVGVDLAKERDTGHTCPVDEYSGSEG